LGNEPSIALENLSPFSGDESREKEVLGREGEKEVTSL